MYKTDHKITAHSMGFNVYTDVIVTPEGKEIIIDFQDVKTGDVKEIPSTLGPGYYEQILVNHVQNKPKSNSLAEKIVRLLNENP